MWNRASRFPSRSTPPDAAGAGGGAEELKAGANVGAGADSDESMDGSQAAILRLMIRACTTMFQARSVQIAFCS